MYGIPGTSGMPDACGTCTKVPMVPLFLQWVIYIYPAA